MTYLMLQQVIARIGNWVRPKKPKGWRIANDGQFISSSNFNAKMNIYVNDKQKAPAESSPFSVKDGQVFIKDAFLKEGGEVRMSLDDKDARKASSSRQSVKDIVGRYLTGEASEHVDEMVEELMSLVQVTPAAHSVVTNTGNMNEIIREAIRKELWPGGLIWAGLRSK